MIEAIVVAAIVIAVAILAVIYWHKKINPDTTWIYGIYCLGIISIFLLFAVITF